jgi:type IV pilus assembly protein PilE
MNKQTRGFTLIELMIVVAIIAIIFAFAWPSYQEHVRKSRRTEGTVHLLELADRLERFYSDQGSYAGATLGPDEDDVYVAVSENGHYNLAITVQDNVSFTVTAAPTTKGDQDDDTCGTFTLTSTGQTSADGSKCWKI